MKLRHPFLISLAARLAAGFIRLLIGTLRYRYVVLDPAVEPGRLGEGFRGVYLFWHDGLLLTASRFRQIRPRTWVLISKHADGQLIAETAERLGYRSVRGSSTRGGIAAMRDMMQTCPDGHIAITPDGPRGPRRVVQSGAVYLGSRTGFPVVAVGVAYDRPWRAKSWDRFAIPRPFSRAVVVMGRATRVPADADKDAVERYRLAVQSALDEANAEAEAVIAGRPAAAAAKAA